MGLSAVGGVGHAAEEEGPGVFCFLFFSALLSVHPMG